jgi:nucleoside-diphosphate-sugar epimerase
MNILVTGGGGLLGRHLVSELVARGDHVRVLALPNEDVWWLEERGIPVDRGDICKPETLVAPMTDTEGVFHLAGMIGQWRPMDDYVAVNVTGTEHVCRAALDAGVRRVVHVSSWTVYGMDRGRLCREDDPIAPFPEPYAVTKAEGDRLVQRMIIDDGLPATIIRPGTFFGPGDRLHFGRIADRLRARRAPIIGRGDNALPLAYVTDIVQGLLLGLDREEAVGEAFNITNDVPLTQEEFFRAIAGEVGAPPPGPRLPYLPLYAAGAAAERVATTLHSRRQPPLTRLGAKLFGTSNRHAIDKARTRLGFEPQVPLREGVRLAAAEYLKAEAAEAAAAIGAGR